MLNPRVGSRLLKPPGSPKIPLEEPAETLLPTGVDDAPCFEGSLCLEIVNLLVGWVL